MSAREEADKREKERSRKAEIRGRSIYVFSPSSPVLGSPGKLVSSSGRIEEQNDTQSKLLFPLEINCLSSETNDSSTLGENPEACPEVNKNKDNEGSDDDSIEDLEEPSNPIVGTCLLNSVPPMRNPSLRVGLEKSTSSPQGH